MWAAMYLHRHGGGRNDYPMGCDIATWPQSVSMVGYFGLGYGVDRWLMSLGMRCVEDS